MVLIGYQQHILLVLTLACRIAISPTRPHFVLISSYYTVLVYTTYVNISVEQG
jgi:hypothetical protein